MYSDTARHQIQNREPFLFSFAGRQRHPRQQKGTTLDDSSMSNTPVRFPELLYFTVKRAGVDAAGIVTDRPTNPVTNCRCCFDAKLMKSELLDSRA